MPDGSYGSIVLGDYVAADGSRANLLTGAYILTNGTTGNIYTGSMVEKPNTAELAMPTPWTSEGVGSAIAASTLGGFQIIASASDSSEAQPTMTEDSMATATASEDADADADADADVSSGSADLSSNMASGNGTPTNDATKLQLLVERAVWVLAFQVLVFMVLAF